MFGYKGLKIKLDFVADTLEPTLNVTWKDKFQEVGETKADDVQEVMKSHMPGQFAEIYGWKMKRADT